MRSFALRPAVAALAAALLSGTTAVPPAQAQQIIRLPTPAAVHAPAGLPRADALAELIRRRVGIPALPPPEIRGLDPDDVVGTVMLPASSGQQAAKHRAPVAPALTFEDGVPAMRSALLTTADPGTGGGVAAPPGSAGASAAEGPALVQPTPNQPAPIQPPPIQPPPIQPPPIQPARVQAGAAAPSLPPPVQAIVTPPGALDAAAVTAALVPFAAAAVPGDTTAQAGDRQKTREAIAAFYAAHDNGSLWIVDGRFSPTARAVLARVDHAAQDALDLGRFPVAVPTGSDPAVLARAELALSEAAVAYGRQAGGSRVDVAHLGGIIDFRPDVPDAARILQALATAPDAGEALRAFNPPQPGYAALREKLAELRQSSPPEARGRIPSGPVLKPGMSDARVPLVRARFGLDVASVEPGVPPMVYDTQVAAAVAEFQRSHGLPASGLLTPRTVAALSGGNPTRLENTIVANMELWRWLPREVAPDRVEVNIPDFEARVLRDGAVMHETRVVVGQPDKPTPVFAQEMRFIIVNPYWNVPLSIIKNEMLPKLAGNPNYFAEHGYEVVERNGVRYVRQPPGEGNALGRIKFMFPNIHSVYLHDTNARSYFARDMRALSHGCVRVEEPFAFAEAVLGRDHGWTEERVRKLIGGQERTVNLPKPLPILITYFTAYVDPAKGFQLRDDVYGYAGRVKLALNLQD